ncbi:hypothetical protein Ddye_007471 [Dipteronia dyeriana]|uniref:Expansin-like EG45 domain-containing protein n=1 Tax=Dipteronia dyeriana TaxID=168575 RepID=A0AAD9XL33_9ROSI|nr:hypothetical protein Ddye_007471 [Dipteronia dyeriana]
MCSYIGLVGWQAGKLYNYLPVFSFRNRYDDLKTKIAAFPVARSPSQINFLAIGLQLRAVATDKTNSLRKSVVAVGEVLWDNGAACGWLYSLRCLSGGKKPCKDGNIDVKVVDFCPKSPCPSTILLSSDAFAAILLPTYKVNIEYVQYVS